MGREFDYEKELLEWRRRQISFRSIYRNTPPGFADDRAEQRERNGLEEAVRGYAAAREYRLLSSCSLSPEPFAGRERYLETIARAFHGGEGPVVLNGVGGIGKSSIAREYIRKYGSNYANICFLSYNGSLQKLICDDIQLRISNLCYNPDKYGSKQRYFQEKLCILEGIFQKRKHLLVIDDWNIKRERDRKRILSLSCDVLITSRMRDSAWEGCRCIPVTALEREEEWNAFFRLYAGNRLDENRKRELAEYRRRVQGHTLFMLLKLKNPEVFDPGLHEIRRDIFFRFPLKREEKQILCELSIMPVQGIQRSLYQKLSGKPDAPIERLKDYLLIQGLHSDPHSGAEEEILVMHPVIAEAARKVFCPTAAKCRELLRGFQDHLEDVWNRTYQENQYYEPYVFALLEAFSESETWLEGVYDVLVVWLWIQGYYDMAVEYGNRRRQSVSDYYGSCHQITGDVALRMGAVYYNALDFRHADEWYRKAYEIFRACEPRNAEYWHLRASAAGKLSRSLRHAGRLEEALDLAGEAECDIRQYMKLSGVGYLALGYHLIAKSRILLGMGRMEEAEQAYLEGCAYAETECQLRNTFRINEFDTVYMEILVQKGEYAEAERLGRQAVERAVHYRGDCFKDTLSCREQLADIYAAEGKEAAALDVYGETLKILRKEYPLQRDWIDRIGRKMRKL